jgi:formate-dependent nitrite reductase cytochrome c552 subunit
MTCHNDQHSKSFESSKHGVLWRAEVAGKGKPGSGVSCATCHMPRMKADSIDDIVRYTTNHNQTENLRPAIKQGKVCLSCHSLQFTLDALADKTLVNGNYNRAPSVHIKSIEMEAKRK